MEEVTKKWDHLPVRPPVFEEFRILKEQGNYSSDNAFIVELLRVFRMRLRFLAKRRLQGEGLHV